MEDLTGKNYYEILGVEPDATVDEIKRAWKKKMKLYHPDRFAHADEEGKKKAHDISKLINEAYRTLRDPDSREEYDISIGLKKPPAPEPAVIHPGERIPIYGTGVQKQQVYTTGDRAQPVYRGTGGTKVYEVIDVDSEVEEIFEVTPPPRKKSRKPPPPPPKPKSKAPLYIAVFALLSGITLLLIAVLPMYVPGMPVIIPLTSGENGSNEEEDPQTRDTDHDGVPDIMDMYPAGNGGIRITITYFQIMNRPDYIKESNPYFVVTLDDYTFPQSKVFYDEEMITETLVFQKDIRDDTTTISVNIKVYSSSTTSDKDPQIDVDPNPLLYDRYDNIHISDLKKGTIYRSYDGSDDHIEDEFDALLMYKVEVVAV